MERLQVYKTVFGNDKLILMKIDNENLNIYIY